MSEAAQSQPGSGSAEERSPDGEVTPGGATTTALAPQPEPKSAALDLPGPTLKVPPLIVVWMALSVGVAGLVGVVGSGSAVLAVFSILAVVMILGAQVRITALRRQAHGLMQRGHKAFSAGNFEVANAELGALAESSGPPELRAQATYFWGLTAMRRGEHRAAKERLASVVDSGWDKRQGLANIAPEIHAFLVIASALEGDLGEAGRRLEAGRRRNFARAPVWFVAEAFVLARGERWRELIDMLDRRSAAIEDTIVGTLMRQLDLLRALALAQLAGDRYRVADESQLLGSVLRGMKYGRFDYLASSWPVMREFMRSHAMLGPTMLAAGSAPDTGRPEPS